MHSEVADVTGNVNYIRKSVFGTKAWGEGSTAPAAAPPMMWQCTMGSDCLSGHSSSQLIITVSFVYPHAQCPIGKATFKVFRYMYLPTPVTSSSSLKLFLEVKIFPRNRFNSSKPRRNSGFKLLLLSLMYCSIPG